MKKNKEYFKVLWKYLKPDKGKVIIFILLSFIHFLEPLVYPFIWSKGLEALIAKDFTTFIIYIVCYDGIAIILDLILSYPRSRLYNILEMNYMQRVSKELYNKVNKLPAIAFEEHGVGEFTNRLVQDPDKVLDLLNSILKLLSKFVIVFIILILAFTTNIIIALEIIGFMIIIFLYSKHFFPIIKKNNEEFKKQSDSYVKRLTQNITGIRDIKALNLTNNIKDITFDNIDILAKDNKQIRQSEIIYYVVNDVIYCLFQFIIMVTCGYLFINNKISFSLFIMLESYIWRISDTVQGLSDFGANYNKVIVSLKRMDEILNNKLFNDEVFGKVKLTGCKGNIEFKDVYFKYRDEEDYILNGLNMKIEPNKKIAIVGKSGQGKSTLFNLLLRYFDCTKGSLLIDGVNIQDLSEDCLRDSISVIRQAPYLFNASIIDNFRYVDKNVSLDKVREVCKEAFIDEYIMGLPNGYETIIGEGGVNLSGGQKQRIAIARTLLKDSKIILFDEATSALDNESQNYIKRTIDNLVKDHSVVIVAHRLSTIQDADLIYVIDDGKVCESGSHNVLMMNSKIYKNLYVPESIDLDML